MFEVMTYAMGFSFEQREYNIIAPSHTKQLITILLFMSHMQKYTFFSWAFKDYSG